LAPGSAYFGNYNKSLLLFLITNIYHFDQYSHFWTVSATIRYIFKYKVFRLSFEFTTLDTCFDIPISRLIKKCTSSCFHSHVPTHKHILTISTAINQPNFTVNIKVYLFSFDTWFISYSSLYKQLAYQIIQSLSMLAHACFRNY